MHRIEKWLATSSLAELKLTDENMADKGRKDDISGINPATLPNFVLKKSSQFEDY